MTDSQPSAKAAQRPHLSQRVTRSLVRINRPSSQVGIDRSGNVDAGLGQGMEMALTVAVFLGLGWLADQALGTSPLFMVILVIFAMVGQSARMWFTYDARMRALELERRQQALGGQTNRSVAADDQLDRTVPETPGVLGTSEENETS